MGSRTSVETQTLPKHGNLRGTVKVQAADRRGAHGRVLWACRGAAGTKLSGVLGKMGHIGSGVNSHPIGWILKRSVGLESKEEAVSEGGGGGPMLMGRP